jgi:hypothetical protein
VSDRARFPQKGVSPAYLGRLSHERDPPREEYVRYASPASEDRCFTRQHYREGAKEEFENLLQDFNLKADDVSGIRKVRIKAHKEPREDWVEDSYSLVLLFPIR